MRHPGQICRLFLPFAIIASTAVQAKDVAVTPAQVERLEIQVADVRSAETETVALLPGTVVPAMNARIVATAPFAGTLVQLHVLQANGSSKALRLLRFRAASCLKR